MSSDFAFTCTPHSIEDRAFWEGVAQDARFAPLLERLTVLAQEAPDAPPAAKASDFLAANRHNDRNRLDRHWQQTRATHSALIVQRCLRGLEANEPVRQAHGDTDDRLLDWLWAALTEATWTVSAHLPDKDLPLSGKPELDLASCEMALLMAEAREVLLPWMDGLSGTLAASVVAEIDRRILTPYADGLSVWWQDRTDRYLNNWLGVCAGSILGACESLARQGFPRPQARARALEGLAKFVHAGFTKNGECDEGVGYWGYGMGFACLGWSRLAREDFEGHVDAARFRLVADYPRRAHLFGNTFFTGNDGGMRARAGMAYVPWLAEAAGNRFLGWWAQEFPAWEARHLSQVLRALAAPAPKEAAACEPSSKPVYLPDQQAGILRGPTPKGELVVTLSGGHNAERHNHNDLGHFAVMLNGEIVVPDMGAPKYTADFFGPKRYTYLPAASAGHCCPVVNGCEQREGAEAAGKLLTWEPGGEIQRLALDLTAAYPPEAGLVKWTRTLERWPASGGLPLRMTVIDVYQTAQPKAKITHLIWSLQDFKEPDERVEGTGFRLRLGELQCEVSPAPNALAPTRHPAQELNLRDFLDQTLVRIEALYRTGEDGKLTVETRFFV